ncbi:MAG: MarR family transcriptional regulator [Clostridiales bacterium]|nr:MarR family transcriptional regulator [Clostridiales bacterium]
MQEYNDCAALIKYINDKMEKRANQHLGIHGITFMQMNMLMELKQMQTDAVPLKTLEKHFKVAQSTAAGIVIRLEKKGLVSSFVPAEDKRLKYIQLTEKGSTLCDTAESDMKEAEHFLLSNLNEEERKLFYELLLKVKDTL